MSRTLFKVTEETVARRDALIKELSDEIDRLRARIAELEASNMAVPVCSDHTHDLVNHDGCVICRIAELMQIVMAVETKHPGEKRWETALRYVMEAENRPCGTAKSEVMDE